MSIIIESFDIEIGIRCQEIEHEILLLAEPVLPANVPALDQKLIHAIVGSKINIAAHIFVVRTMAAVRHSL